MGGPETPRGGLGEFRGRAPSPSSLEEGQSQGLGTQETTPPSRVAEVQQEKPLKRRLGGSGFCLASVLPTSRREDTGVAPGGRRDA